MRFPCKGSGASLPHARCPAAILRSEWSASRRRACLYLRRRHKHAGAYLPRFHGTAQNTNPITLDGGGFAAIWIPSAPIDVAVFNSSGTQQYKVLNVTALPLVVTSLTANLLPIQQHESRAIRLPADGKRGPNLLAQQRK